MKKLLLAALITSSVSFPLQAEFEPKFYFTVGCALVAVIPVYKLYKRRGYEYSNRGTLMFFSAFVLAAGAYFHFAPPAQ